MEEQLAIRSSLQSQLTALRSRNPRMSVRGYARRLGISAGTLSLVLLGKRRVSAKLARKLTDSMALPPPERGALLDLIEKKAARSNRRPNSDRYLRMEADKYFLLTEWENFAILNLATMNAFQGDPDWIAQRLGIPRKKAADAMERLVRSGYLEQLESGGWRRSKPSLTTTEDTPNEWIKKSHGDTLTLAQEKLGTIPVPQRDFTWITFPMNPKTLASAKKMIRRFQDELMDQAEVENEPTEVYRMAVQLFPLTQLEHQN
ncbi:MAG: TIGR02147 family protein [Deltaproteobacteria bacterium]|nr:TIGR02147 family protein [Deltaproteobacteria bacterium]MBI3294208.1 TIGR02147 family protein [Deltaproteobacteria bacterium]